MEEKHARFGSETARGRFYQRIRKYCDTLDQRFVTTFLLAFGILCNYMQRICFYITLVEMTKREKVQNEGFMVNQEGTWERCPFIFLDTDKQTDLRDWSDETQGQLIASFSAGHFLSSVFGGFIADRYGGKNIFSATLILTSLCSFLTPLAAIIDGPYIVMFVRFLMGIVQGPMFPAGAAILSKWSPSHERPLHSAVANSGVPLGSFLGNLLAGTILSNCSWQWVFYIYGFLGILCFILWEVFVFSSPATHKYISAAERTFIEYSIHFSSPITRGKIPWKQIFSSYKFLVVVCANFGFDWGFYIVSLELPFYLYHVLHLPIMKIGAVASMPWLSMWIGALIFGMVSQYLIGQGIIRKIDMRKSMAIISTLVPAVLLMLASFATCSHVVVCLLFSLSMFYAGAVYSGLRLSVMDLAPNFSGVLMSLVNAFGSLTGIAVPMIVHSIIQEGGTIMQWRISFWIATVFMFVLSLPYFLFATCAVQEWNRGLNPQNVDVFPRETVSPRPVRKEENEEVEPALVM
ncbi:sialin [Halyomorpha halys]|uniref:sialin n=1 Tax=Halyomorpha halys TaxID=286706 RepID=UPI0006D508BB